VVEPQRAAWLVDPGQPGVAGLGDPGRDLLGVDAERGRHLVERVVADGGATHREHVHQLPGGRAEAVPRRQEGLAQIGGQALRQLVGAWFDRTCQEFGEVRVPTGALVRAPGQGGRCGGPDDGTEEVLGFTASQPAQPHHADSWHAHQVCQPPMERVRGSDVGVAVGADDQEPLPLGVAGDQEAEDVERAHVRPLQVVDDQRDRAGRQARRDRSRDVLQDRG
jgi:hypothetical protein